MGVSRERRSLSTSIKVGGRKPVTNIETVTLIRSMYQADIKKGSPTALSYEFHFGISTFTHEGAGVLYTEIPRPLNLPLVDATSQKLERCSFEFLIAIPYDSVDQPVDSHMSLLQDFAYDARPVNFLNVHSALALKTWNIDSMSFQVTRVNRSGKATAVTCNMSLVEYIARTNERFYGLPKFSYAIPKGTGLAGTTGTGNDTVSVIGNITKIEGFIGGQVKVTTATNHGLKNGTKVKIAMTASLLANVRALYDQTKVYEISVTATSPTTFIYNNVTSGLRTEYPVVLPDAINYSTTDKEINAPFVPEVIVNDPIVVGSAGWVYPANKGAVDSETVQLGSAPLYANPILDEAITKYLFELKIANPEMYNKGIGNTSSAAYQKAKAYLVKIYNPSAKVHGAIYMVDLKEIIEQMG